MTHSYKITGMTCENCVSKVKTMLSKIEGITNVEINRINEAAEITMIKHVSTSELANALHGTNYVLTELNSRSESIVTDEEEITLKSYLPIFLIFGYITTVTLIVELLKDQFILTDWMSYFMSGFFLVFSFFKLLDLPAFANSYTTYDIIAKRIPSYGYVYPFIELALGLAFLIPSLHYEANIATFLVMSVSLVGVIQILLTKRQFQCACLGAFFKLPLSKITLFEDSLMVVMSLISITVLK